jgi:hypothetical protein
VVPQLPRQFFDVAVALVGGSVALVGRAVPRTCGLIATLGLFVSFRRDLCPHGACRVALEGSFHALRTRPLVGLLPQRVDQSVSTVLVV